MVELLTHADISSSLSDFATAIELDQRRVDALPTATFSPMYDARMWRDWRANSIAFVEKMISSVNSIPKAMVVELTELATSYSPLIVRRIVLEILAEVVSGFCDNRDFATAELFFGRVIGEVKQSHSVRSYFQGAKRSISLWLPVVDPLRIASDPECQYPVMELS